MCRRDLDVHRMLGTASSLAYLPENLEQARLESPEGMGSSCALYKEDEIGSVPSLPKPEILMTRAYEKRIQTSLNRWDIHARPRQMAGGG